jgi:hypothetical protein
MLKRGRIVAADYSMRVILLGIDRAAVFVASDDRNHRAALSYDQPVADLIAKRFQEIESGARVFGAILTYTVVPTVSLEVLNRTMGCQAIGRTAIGVGEAEFTHEFR